MVLNEAFNRVRSATPVDIDTRASAAAAASGVVLTNQKIGAPVQHVNATSLVAHDNARIQNLQSTLAALQAAFKANDNSVEYELARRIPWLADEVLPSGRLSGSQQSEAANATLNLISFVTDKKATLLSKNSGGATTTFGAGDQKQLLPTLQQLAGLAPFRLVTLLVAQQIIDQFPEPRTDATETPQLIALVAIFNAADFLATYFDAYFRSNQFIQVTVDERALENEVLNLFNTRLSSPLPDSAQTDLRNAIAAACNKIAGNCASPPALGTTSFIALFGQSVQFGGVTIAVSDTAAGKPVRASAPAVGVFGPQMTQVLIEALFDANGPHPPALTTSTACVTGLYSMKSECVAPTKTDSLWSKTNLVGNATEGLMTAGVGTVIRGGNVAALNNEAIASIVETLAGVSTRKAVQQIMAFCGGNPSSASVSQQATSK
ncbi:hypothetical protein [Paraburkholderia adhaesiva]|uniref:hypothetical protein n=1 Tax=Paraburkholderia adhaesiva TaxID=2883244 RepID=UPI001F3667C6|nr:hypothetical protein [Paraburkholderia adhaesiva]